VIFVAGAAIGSAVTWFTTKSYYERIAQEEINSVKEYYKTKNVGDAINEGIEKGLESKPLVANTMAVKLAEIQEKVNKLGYTNYSNTETKVDEVEKPYVIEPQEFGELDDYDTNELTYFADGVLADDAMEIVDDVESIVGADFADHFGDYEPDSVYIRNDMRKRDYLILADERDYYSIVDDE
jgi:hypothetical protein